MKIQIIVIIILVLYSVLGCSNYAPLVYTLEEKVDDNIHARIVLPEKANATETFPGVILLPGASGVSKNGQIFETAKQIADAGFCVLVVDYYRGGLDLEDGDIINTPKASREAWLTNIENAHKWLKKHRQVDDSGISIVGFSRGAQYAMEYANRSGDIRSIVSFYGILFAYDENRFPMSKDVANLPPTLLIHGDNDTIVDIKFSEEIVALSSFVGKSVELISMPGMEHAWWFRTPYTVEKASAYTTAIAHTLRFLTSPPPQFLTN